MRRKRLRRKVAVEFTVRIYEGEPLAEEILRSDEHGELRGNRLKALATLGMQVEEPAGMVVHPMRPLQAVRSIAHAPAPEPVGVSPRAETQVFGGGSAAAQATGATAEPALITPLEGGENEADDEGDDKYAALDNILDHFKR